MFNLQMWNIPQLPVLEFNNSSLQLHDSSVFRKSRIQDETTKLHKIQRFESSETWNAFCEMVFLSPFETMNFCFVPIRYFGLCLCNSSSQVNLHTLATIINTHQLFSRSQNACFDFIWTADLSSNQKQAQRCHKSRDLIAKLIMTFAPSPRHHFSDDSEAAMASAAGETEGGEGRG